jgi:hypothetical protein
MSARIGEVNIRVVDVFDETDPSENRKIFRFVNRLHRRTRDWVIREQLLFESGDLYSARLLEESERYLREKRYLYDAEIRPTRYRSGLVDVDVKTRDVWTDVDRTSSQVTFEDKNLFGTRGHIEVSAASNSDGYRHLLKLGRPFFALDTRRTKGIVIILEDRVDPLFELGELTAEFRHQIDFFETYWGFSKGLKNRSVTRWKFGHTYSSDRFSPVPGPPSDLELPPDRTFSYPWVDFEFIQDRFVEARDLNRIARTEDINLGTRVQGRLGLSTKAFGGDETVTLAGLNAGTGFRPSAGTLLFFSANAGARWSRGDLETAVVGTSTRFFWRDLGNHALFGELQVAFVRDLDPEKQLLLGGDSGLRGYPLRFQSGDRRVLLTLEQRFFTDLELFKIANLGAAVFFDIGRAWFVGSEAENQFGILKDVGFGLRLSSSRSSGKSMLHFDVAFPLDGDDTIDSVQFLVTTKESF